MYFIYFLLYEYMSISPQKDLCKITIFMAYVVNQIKYHTLPYCVCIQQLWGVSSKKILLALPIMSSDDEHSFSFSLSLPKKSLLFLSYYTFACDELRSTSATGWDGLHLTFRTTKADEMDSDETPDVGRLIYINLLQIYIYTKRVIPYKYVFRI